MRRKFYTLMAFVWSVLCAAACALWVTSHFVTPSGKSPPAGLLVLHMGEGDEYLSIARGRLYESIYTPWDGKVYPESQLPLWVLSLAGGAVALGFWYARRRVHGMEPLPHPYFRGLCPNCGYDLCASPGHCPECGNRAREALPSQ